MKCIKLTGRFAKGQCAVVDDADFKYLNQWTWFMDSNGYIARNVSRFPKSPKRIYMHRAVMEAGSGTIIDHINRTRYDNRKSNLRFATKSLNMLNKGKQKNNTSGYLGVWLRKDTQKWSAEIKVNGKKLCLGSFEDIADAVKARQKVEAEALEA